MLSVSGKPKGLHIAVDLQPMFGKLNLLATSNIFFSFLFDVIRHPIKGASILAPLDFTELSSQAKITEMLEGQQVDVVLSDMVRPYTTHYT